MRLVLRLITKLTGRRFVQITEYGGRTIHCALFTNDLGSLCAVYDNQLVILLPDGETDGYPLAESWRHI